MKRHAFFILICAAVFSLIFGFSGSVHASQSERILDFKSLIRIHKNGSMTVSETIRVFCAGRSIRHGIYRDFPTTYRGLHGNTFKVSFHVLRVSRDGASEAYHLKSLSNGIRVYIGRKKVFVPHGIHTYTLVYKTDRQLGFFKDHDELYWNVTGNGWRFPMEHVSATIILPPGAKITQRTAYTGVKGARGADYSAGTDANGNVTFETTRLLRPGEGISIVVAWPKGVVHEPTRQDKVRYFLRDNASLIAAFLGLVVLFIYYLVAWIKVGKDPEKGTIIPRFHPPDGFSPAAVRFVMQMGFDHKALAVAIVDMAVKGALTISQDADKVFTLYRVSKGGTKLSGGEQKILDALFDSSGMFVLKSENHRRVQDAIKALKKTLGRAYEKNYFLRNTRYFIPGLVITLLSLGAVVLSARNIAEAGFMALWLSIWTVSCIFLLKMVVAAWRARQKVIQTTFFALPFFAGEIFGLIMFISAVSVSAGFLLLVVVFVNLLFYHLLKAPTRHGRRIMDEIEGLKLYLSTAEEERLKLMHPPDKTPELFEAFLPYAMALDVENKWSEKFEDVLAGAAAESGYQPVWYRGGTLDSVGLMGMASGIGSSLSSAIVSSSSAPGSSSGFGGGGGSGGGGGGGGGGGW